MQAEKKERKRFASDAKDRQFHDPDPNASDDSDEEVFDGETSKKRRGSRSTKTKKRSRSCRGRSVACRRRAATLPRRRTKKKQRKASVDLEESTVSEPSAATAHRAQSTSMPSFYEYMRRYFNGDGELDSSAVLPTDLDAASVSDAADSDTADSEDDDEEDKKDEVEEKDEESIVSE